MHEVSHHSESQCVQSGDTPAPPLSMLDDTHQRSKIAKKGVILNKLRRSLKMKKRVGFACKISRF